MEREFADGLVSVIIPAYNVANYISETIHSVLIQTYQNFEILVIDDCSTDDTGAIVKRLEEKDSRIRYMEQERNMGAAEARNRGIREAAGRYIAFLDSDDLWNNEKLKKQLDDMENHNVAFSFTAYDFVDDKGVKIKDSIKIKRKVTYKTLLTKTMISTPTVVIDRKKTGELLMPLRRTGQDYAFWLLLLRNNNAFGIDEALVHIRRRPGSLSKNKLQNIKDVWEVQTINEGIGKLPAFIHLIGYCFYTLKKRYLK